MSAKDEGDVDAAKGAELAAAERDLVRLAKRARSATLERDRAMLRMRRAGGSLRAIGEAAGVNHQTVVNVLERLKRLEAGDS